MSDLKVIKADGCGTLLSVLFIGPMAAMIVFLYSFSRSDEPVDATNAVDKSRALKVGEYRNENSAYNELIDSYHSERNSSLQGIMEKVSKTYRTKASPQN